MAARAIRERGPLIGYAVSRRPVSQGDTTTTTTNNNNITSGCDGGEGRYDSRIMHHVVAATLEVWRVEVDATDEVLAGALGVSVEDIRAHWLTSRSALIDPRPPRSTTLSTTTNTITSGVGYYRRYSRRRHSVADTTTTSATTGMPAFKPLSLATLQAYRDLATELRARLHNINNNMDINGINNTQGPHQQQVAGDGDSLLLPLLPFESDKKEEKVSTSLESVSCGVEPLPFDNTNINNSSKGDLDLLYGTPL